MTDTPKPKRKIVVSKTVAREPKISWDEIEELQSLHARAQERLPADATWRDRSDQSNARWLFQEKLQRRWPDLYAELKDAYRGE